MSRGWLWLVMALIAGCGADSGDTSVVSLQTGNLILTANHGDDGSAWGLADCAACHALPVIHRQAEHIGGIVRAGGYDTCAGCHGSNGTDQARRCVICHNGNDLPGMPQLQGEHGHVFVAGSGDPLGDAQCVVCHAASDMDGQFEINRDLTRFRDTAQGYAAYGTVSDFCLRCHNRDHQQPGFEMTGSGYDDPLIAIEDDYRYLDKHGAVDGGGRTYAGLRSAYAYGSRVTCTDCHAMHGTDNQKLIIDASDKGARLLPPSLRDVPYAVTIAGGDFSQLCVLCHKMAVELDAGGVDTGNGLAGVHATGGDCRPCHRHGEAVQAGM